MGKPGPAPLYEYTALIRLQTKAASADGPRWASRAVSAGDAKLTKTVLALQGILIY